MKPNDAVAHVQPYVGKDVTNAFAGKVLKEAKALASASLSASKFKPLAELVNASGIGHLTVHTTNAEGMKKIYKARMKAEHELKEKDLPDKAKTPFVEPNTEHITDEGGEYLTGYTYVPGAIKALWNAGLVEKTPSFADGAHSEGAFGGTFLSTTTLDANRHLLPMCVTWTIMNEDKESWTSHYRAVKEHYPALDVSTHANITDGDKGLKPSRAEVFPNMLGFSCERHRSENVRVQPGVGSAGRDAYREAVYGYSAAKLAHAKSIMNAQTKAYLEKLPDKCQYLRAAFEAGAHLRGYAVSSPAESWNNWMTNQSVRHNANVVQSFLNLMDGIENQTEKVSAAAKRTDAAPPKIRLLLNSGGEAKKKVRDRVVVFQNNLRRVAKVWHKSYPGICQTVNLMTVRVLAVVLKLWEVLSAFLLRAPRSLLVWILRSFCRRRRLRSDGVSSGSMSPWRAGKTIPCIADLALLPEHPLKDPVAGPRPKGRPAEPKRHSAPWRMQPSSTSAKCVA
ncbi:SWIM-type domain-containing protein [Pycnococcus provasolii]